MKYRTVNGDGRCKSHFSHIFLQRTISHHVSPQEKLCSFIVRGTDGALTWVSFSISFQIASDVSPKILI